MEYSVVVHEAEAGGVWVDVPALPGCYSRGESVEEALGNVREATGSNAYFACPYQRLILIDATIPHP